jgi:hypothetical protein
MEGGLPSIFAKRAHAGVKSLLTKHILKAKKNKYQFTSLGEIFFEAHKIDFKKESKSTREERTDTS